MDNNAIEMVFDGARFVRVDSDHNLIFIWYGGFEVFIYDSSGNQDGSFRWHRIGSPPDYLEVHDWVVTFLRKLEGDFTTEESRTESQE